MALTIALAGASGAGKTTLASALDKALGPTGSVPIIDAPGGDLSSALSAQLGVAILVVAVSDGPMKQTKEHLLALSGRVPVLIVFMNKTDLVEDAELMDLVEMEVRELVTSCGFNGDQVPVLKGSALQSTGQRGDPAAEPIFALADALSAFAA